MIKKLWEAIHFGSFKSQWRNSPDTQNPQVPACLGRTLFYENVLVETDKGVQLVTRVGGLLGRYAFYAMLPVYMLFAYGLATGMVHVVHFALFEAAFIAVFGYLNGLALHRLAQEPDFGVESLSFRQIQRA